jgi:hypothetical protein
MAIGADVLFGLLAFVSGNTALAKLVQQKRLAEADPLGSDNQRTLEGDLGAPPAAERGNVVPVGIHHSIQPPLRSHSAA